MKFSADNQLFTQISNILRKVDFCGNNIGSPLLYRWKDIYICRDLNFKSTQMMFERSKNMKNVQIALVVLLFLVFGGCENKNSSEKSFDFESNVIDVKEKVQCIQSDSIELSRIAIPYICGSYLVVSDMMSPDQLIRVYDKNDFSYKVSVGERGRGPGEIANMLGIVPCGGDDVFFVADVGNQKLLRFDLQKVLSDTVYMPEEIASLDKGEFPYTFHYVNDTLCYAQFFKVNKEQKDYVPVVAKWNPQTGEKTYMSYEGNPEVKEKRVSFAVSPQNDCYVEAYWHDDLLTILSTDGQLKYTIYGKEWGSSHSVKQLYFGNVVFAKNLIIAAYRGGDDVSQRNGATHGNYPDKLLLFKTDGTYIETLQVGYPILNFAYDDENNRV
jgi:hypothetical protein